MVKKILIFSIAYPPFVGGAELAIKEITDRIGDIQFDMITLRFDSSLPRFERMGNINVYRIGFTRVKPTMADLVKMPLAFNKIIFPVIACFKARQLNKKNHYDMIWAMMAAYAGFAAMFFKVFNPRIKYLLTLQEGDPIDYILQKVKFIRPIFNKIFTKADYVQAISTYLGTWAQDMGFKGGLSIIPNAVDVKVFTQIFLPAELEKLKADLKKEKDDIFLVHSGRSVLKNALDDIIRSLQFLPANIKFLVIGTGPDDNKLKQLAKDLQVEDRVLFQGFFVQKDTAKFLKVSDIFIRPSLSEGLGNSFLEAMAADLPVIATPVGGITDFLFDPEKNPKHEPTGLYCQVRNPQSIADCVQKYLSDKELTARIVTNAKQMVLAKYDWKIIAGEMNKIFNEL